MTVHVRVGVLLIIIIIIIIIIMMMMMSLTPGSPHKGASVAALRLS